MADNYVVSGGMGVKFKLIQAFMVVLVTCKNDEDQSKNELTRELTTFLPIISLWEFFQTLKGSKLHRTWSDLAEFRIH